MALNTDFRVKDSLHVGNSACFVGQTNAPTILSAGSSLFDIFLQEGEVSASCTLSGGLGVTSGGTFDGTTDRVFSVNTGVINSVALGDEQGRICTTNLGGSESQICITNLGITGTPTFGGTTVTGISATAVTAGILSAGRDLADIFVTSACAGSVCSVTAEAGKPTITIGGTAANPTVRIADTCVTAISSAFCTITTDGSQGNIGLTRLNGGTSTLDIGLCCGDIVTFGGLNAGTSGISTTGLSATAANSGILSAGKDLNEIFQTIGSDSRGKVLSQGIGIQDFTYEGLSAQSIAVSKSILSGGSSHAQGILTLSGAGGVGYNADINLGLGSGCSPTFSALTTSCITTNGNIVVTGTVDGVDIEARDAILTETTDRVSAALPLSGGAMTGNITTNSCFDGVCVSQLATCPGLNATGTVCGTGTANFIPLWSNGTTQCDSTLSIHDSAVTSSNAISAVGGFAGDGSNLTGVTATACFPGTIKTTLVGGDKFFLNDGTNKHTTYTTVLTSFASGCGLTTSGTGLTINGAAALATNNLPRWDGSGFVDSIVKQTAAGNVNIAGGTTISGNLSVTGDFTCIETLLQTTSAVCIVNAGTGPALYAEQTGASQPIAKFVDTEGTNDSGTVIIDDSGKVGIGTASPSEKLTFVGNLSGIGNSTITGTSNVTGLATFDGGITACIGSTTGQNNVVVSDGGSLGTDGIDGKVWLCKLVDFGSSACNGIPKFNNTTGTLDDSNISDTGSLITLGSNVTLGNASSLKLPAAGGTFFTEEKTFTATVGTSETGVPTFAKSGLKQVKYLISLTKGVNITAFEVNAVYNGTAPCGTTYGIVDAQAASQLADIKITSAGSTIDLDITALAATTTAVIHGVAVY